MKHSQAKSGRVFVVRLEDGEILHETIEEFASEPRPLRCLPDEENGAKGGYVQVDVEYACAVSG